MNYKKISLYISYIILAIIVITINAHYVVEWLNRSLYIDYTIDYEKINETFNNGKSIIILLTLFIFSIVGSTLMSIIFTNLIAAALVVANNIKVRERTDLLTFSELKTISSPKDVLALIEISTGTVFTALIVIAISLIIFHILIYKIGKKIGIQFNYKFRGILFLITLSLFITIYNFPNEYNEKVLQLPKSDRHNSFPLDKAQRDGFIPSLISTIKPDYMNKLKDYNSNKMTEISNKYSIISEQINHERENYIQNDTTIFYLSESLMNPDKIPELLNGVETLPTINSLIKNNYGGSMYSQFVGGGTANIEWTALTSFSPEIFRSPISTTPYSDFYIDSPNHSTIISNVKKNAIALHPHSAHLYKRRSVYPKIGFKDFKFLNNGIEFVDKLGDHLRISDKSLNKDIFRELKEPDVEFLHVLSMQNHSPYTRTIPNSSFNPNINKEFFKKGKKDELINYLQGIWETDQVIDELITFIDKQDKNINLVFYGDHFPNVFNSIKDQFTEYGLHETPWFIYLNNGRNEIKKTKELLSPMFFTTALLEAGDYKVSPFQALLTKIYEADVNRVGSNFVYINNEQVADEDLPEELKTYIEDYRLIMYDALFGKGYLSKAFFQD